MRIIKKNSKKDFEEQIQQLKKELAELKKTSKKNNNSDNLGLEAFCKFIQLNNTDLLCYDSESNQLEYIFPNKEPGLIKNIPTSLSEFQKALQVDKNESLSEIIIKIGDKPFIKIHTKYLSNVNTHREYTPVEITLLKYPSQPSKTLIAIHDSSVETKQKKDLQKSREKIEESDKLKSIILSNISHHIRTPLNSVTGFSELLASSDYNGDKKKEFIDIIKRQSKRILTLIDDLSEIAKLETGKINISKTPCSLNLILNELLMGINKHRAEQRREEVEVLSNFPDNGLEIMTDPGRLIQALTHLLNYSLRYTNQGKIELGYYLLDEGDKIEFFIEDTSEGLTKEEQKIIFNKFTTIDTTESTRMTDPGLGLTIAKAIIKALGGKIWVESEETKGTKFIFQIPYETVPPNVNDNNLVDEELIAVTQYEWPNKVVLIVDDEEVNAMFLDAVFHGTSAQLIFAKNGREAIDLCKSITKIDLILMDLKMPVLNGLKATKEIRKFNSKIPIIAQTALASEKDTHSCEEAGCDEVITKPIDVEELLGLANKFLAD